MIASRPSVQLYPVARISRGGSVLAVLVVGLIGMAACGGSSEPSVPNRPSATAASATAVTTTTDGNLSQAGDDIRVNPELVNEGGDFTTAVPILYDLPSDDPLRTGVSVDTALDLVERVRNIGGYDVGQLQIRLTLESRRNQKIVVSGLDLTDVKESTAIRGTLLRLNEEGGVPNEQLVYNLSDSLPRAHETKADGTIDESPYFMNKSIEVGANEPTVVLAQFNAKPQHSTEFKLRLSYRSAGKSRNAIIDNAGHPFKVTSVSCNQPGTYVSDYDHAYTMETDPTYGLVMTLAPDPHNVSAGLLCPSN